MPDACAQVDIRQAQLNSSKRLMFPPKLERLAYQCITYSLHLL